MSLEPTDLDLGHLALFVGLAVNDAVLAALAKAGHAALRTSHGFVFQHLVDGERRIGELAERQGVTQQAISKAIAELEGLGYVERTTDATDARLRLVRLSKRGHDAVAASRRARATVEKKLVASLGAAAVAETRAHLARALDLLGGSEAVRGRRVRAP
jgi:DNA-binding MarR family transcriptional regulator